MRDILEVIKNIDDLYENNTNMAILKDMERVFDELDLYVYENWEDGELASGPFVDRHWITASFMWPKDKMPNPIAGKRLMELGCKIKYEKTHLIEVRKVKKPSDLRPGTKKGKLDHKPIWIVEIQMPKKIAFDIYRGYMDRMKTEMVGTSKAPQAGTPVPGGPAPTTGMPTPPTASPAASTAGAAPTAGAPTAAAATV